MGFIPKSKARHPRSYGYRAHCRTSTTNSLSKGYTNTHCLPSPFSSATSDVYRPSNSHHLETYERYRAAPPRQLIRSIKFCRYECTPVPAIIPSAENRLRSHTNMPQYTKPGDIVFYKRNGIYDVVGDSSEHPYLSDHFMLIMPKRFKPPSRRDNPSWHACLVISSHPVGSNVPLIPQRSSTEIHKTSTTLRTLGFDASRKDRELTDELESWEWKDNTSLCIENVKTAHEANLQGVRWPERPKYGLKLSRAAFQEVLFQLTPSLLRTGSIGILEEDEVCIN
ncbi:MAG: hypothetical protein LQ342_002601 [Letrouitia transgressa]|nr:MAG: hypothetical protein LQ342_002601 [Letrouitia transgressa]